MGAVPYYFSKLYLFIGAYSPDHLSGRCLALSIFKTCLVARKQTSGMEWSGVGLEEPLELMVGTPPSALALSSFLPPFFILWTSLRIQGFF